MDALVAAIFEMNRSSVAVRDGHVRRRPDDEVLGADVDHAREVDAIGLGDIEPLGPQPIGDLWSDLVGGDLEYSRPVTAPRPEKLLFTSNFDQT